MDASDGNSSDVDAMESQATQLIHAALEQSPGFIKDRDRSGSNNDSSTHSFPSSKNSASSSAHQYHFHGLASTQTQPLSDNEEASGIALNEGSQNEISKVAENNNRPWKLPSPDWGPSPPQNFSSKDKTAKAGQSSTSVRPTKSKVLPSLPHTKIAKPQHPQNSKNTGAQPVRSKGKLRSESSRHYNDHSHSSDYSQDSFAQGDSQFSEEILLVTSKKFTMPIADLSLTDEEDYPTRTVGRVPQPNHPPRDNQKLDEYSSVILVPSTPSQSGSSDYSNSVGKRQSLPQNDDSFEQGQDTDRAMLDKDSSRGSQHSQGFDGQEEVAEVQGLYSTKHDTKLSFVRPLPPLNTNLLEATQVATQEATQIATQEAVVLTPSSVAPPTSTTTNVGPRSLLSTMDPNKRNRYQHLMQYTPNTPVSPAQQRPAGGRKRSGDNAEKTPSLEILDRPKTAVSSPRRKSPQVPSAKPSPRRNAHKQPQGTSALDVMDVVPDSEPMREIVQTSVSEEKIMDLDDLNKKRRERASDSEETEYSDVMPPRKFLRLEKEGRVGNEMVTNKQMKAEEEEEEEEEEEKEEEEEDEDEEGEGEGEGVDNDDDDDEPLSARLRKSRSKAPVVAPQKVGNPSQPTNTYDSKRATRTRAASAAKQDVLPRRQKANRNTSPGVERVNDSIVPSSVPNQDQPRTRRLKAAAKKEGKHPLRQSSRATSFSKSKRGHRSTEEDTDIEMEEACDSDGATEPADEPSEYIEPEVPSQSLKRKRGRPPKSKDTNVAAVTPITRLTKRLKSAGSSTSRANATRVFALWSRNKLYYPGVVHESIGDGKYNIKFDDGAEGIASMDDMRTYNLRAGDLVRLYSKSKDHKVHKVNLASNKVTLEIAGETEDVPMKEISVSVKNITSSWHDRRIDKQPIIPVMRFPDAKPSPSPSRSAGSFLSAKGSRLPPKFLQRVGLIVSLSGNGTNDRTKDGQLRTEILTAVRDSGGVLVDDLFKYLRMDLEHLSNRWVGESTDAHWVGEPRELQRLFLLADDCNHKPKYLMALALGIPCVSVKWLYSCLDAAKEVDWRSYLLPQGRPNVIDAQPSQQIDLNWGNRPEHLSEIMENPVAPRILKDQSILCVGPDMTPKSKDTDKGEAASYIMRIILAMGATRVEAVRDTTFAARPLSEYDLLVIRDREHYRSGYSQTHTVDWNWIKDSLIMSRFLPRPEWPVEEESQCSQSL